MAFEGDLTNLGLADIFQTLGMNRQSGTLVVKQGETERRFYFTDEGVSLLTTRSARKFRLGNLLVGMGKLSEGDLKVAVLKQERAKDTKLGDILLQTGLVKNEDIKEACKYQAAEEIYDSFSWTSGKFQFLEGANAGPAGGPGPFSEFFFSVTDIVMEAARRSDEYSLNLKKIGSLEEFYARVEGATPDEAEVGRVGCLLHKVLDGTMDVKQVFEEFFLSPFDTSSAFVTLIDRGLVKTMDAAGLRAAAEPFTAAKDHARAARMLGRAARLAPEDPALLAALGEAQGACEDRKEASRTFAQLGALLQSGAQRTEAVDALRKSIEHDSRNERAYEQLMEVYASLDQMDRAEEACREASRLLSDERDFDASMRLLDRGLGFLPDSIPLRLQRANSLIALGKREDGLKEMTAVAADLEGRRSDAALTLSVYRKLLQLEPDSKEYRAKVDDLVAGEKARETRRRMLRVAAGLAGVAVLVIAWILWPESNSSKLARAEEAIKGGDPRSVEELVRGLKGKFDAGSEQDMTLDRLIGVLDRLAAAPERRKRVEAIEKRLREEFLAPAEKDMAEGRYVEGAERVLLLLPELKSKSLQEFAGDELTGMFNRVQTEYRKILTVPADVLREDAKVVRQTLSDVGGIEVSKADEARQRQVLAAAGKALALRQKADWTKVVAVLRRAAASDGLPGLDSLRVPDLLLTLEQMTPVLATLQETYNRADAEVRQREIHARYSAAKAEVLQAKSTGDIAKGIQICDAFLKSCDELRRAVGSPGTELEFAL